MNVVPISSEAMHNKSTESSSARKSIAYINTGILSHVLPTIISGSGYQLEFRDADDTTIADVVAGMFDAAVVDFGDEEAAEQFVTVLRAAAQGSPVAIVAVAEGPTVARAFRCGARFALEPTANPDLVRQTLRSALLLTQGVKRQFARHTLNVPVEISGEGTHATSVITDIGPGGLAVRCEQVDVGEVVKLRFTLPGTARAINVVGIARWRDGDRCGLAFRGLDPGGSAELANWIARRATGDEPVAEQAKTATSQPAAVQIDPWVEPRKSAMGDWALSIALGVFSLLVLIFWIYMLAS